LITKVKSIGRITIESTLENATAYEGIIPLLDFIDKIQLTDHLEEYLSVSKQGGTFPLSLVITALVLGRLLEWKEYLTLKMKHS